METFKKISIHLILLVLFIFPIFIQAQATQPPVTPTIIKINNPFNCGTSNPNNCNLMDLITAVLTNIIMPIAAVAVVVYIIYAGFTYVMAQGKPVEIEKAHQRLLWSLVGAGILLGAAGIAAVVKSTIEAIISP